MTTFTVKTESSIVHIVPTMTTITGSGQTDFFHRLRMTGNTFYRFMLSGQPKFGPPVVIKNPFFP